MATKPKIVNLRNPRQPKADGRERQRVLAAILREERRARPGPPQPRSDPQDFADAAQATEEEIVEVANLERRQHLLVRVDEALYRLAAGRYGVCAECGERIPSARLRALPFAVRCCPCQERFERETGAYASVRGVAP